MQMRLDLSPTPKLYAEHVEKVAFRPVAANEESDPSAGRTVSRKKRLI
jgi:hypothetical protein